MTVIAWDGKTLAADKRAVNAGLILTVTKIKRVNDVLVGGTGSPDFIGEMVEWVRAGRETAAFPASQRDKDDWQPFVVIERDGTVSKYERTPYPLRYEDQHFAMGSGRDYAMAALHIGLTAAAAVKVASALDNSCGNGVDTLTLLD